jgi:hypothetical protein
LFNQHYAVLGTFTDVTSFPFLGLTDPRTFVPGIAVCGLFGGSRDTPDDRASIRG